jgi:hypothetical protein
MGQSDWINIGILHMNEYDIGCWFGTYLFFHILGIVIVTG